MRGQRSLIVLAALLLVLAFALATAGKGNVPLAELLGRIDPMLATRLRTAVPAWMADRILLPLLIRPAWLLPLALGLVCAGGAVTVAAPKSLGRTRLH
jgi:hypothetical protein